MLWKVEDKGLWSGWREQRGEDAERRALRKAASIPSWRGGWAQVSDYAVLTDADL